MKCPGFPSSLSLCFAVVPLLLSGCASYYSHYAVFPAENSQGEARQVKLTWQTAEYPGWWVADNKSTPITVETQCSTRKWRLVDNTHEEASQAGCGDGIRASSVPYTIYSRKSPRGRLNARPPELDDAVCEDNE